MGGGDKRIVCAAVAKGEMIFEFIRKKGKWKGKKREGTEQWVEQVSSLSTPDLPSLPPPVQKVWGSSGGGATKSDKN